ncbi:MAG: hypothetical protein WCP63_11800 [Cyanobium sp. ELA712]
MNKLTSKTRTAFLVAGLLSGAALSSIVFSAPAKAACGTGILSDLTSTSRTCGDKNYTFGPSFFTNFLPTDLFSIGVDVNQKHTLSVLSSTGGWGPGTYILNYDVAVTGPPFEMYGYSADLQAPGGGSASYTMTGNGNVPSGPPCSAQAILGSPSVKCKYNPTVTMDSFTTTLVVNAGTSVTGITALVDQRKPDDTVPGPLPLLGAGAAFGFSRRIRSRIKASA